MSYLKNRLGNSNIDEIIRVNQAGEFGALCIYEGQLAAIAQSDARDTIVHMYHQELDHLKYFNSILHQNRIRPTAMSPIWKFGAYALGYFSGKLGVKAAMACTAAVEEVIEKHYQEQIDSLQVQNDIEHYDLLNHIKQFQLDEIEHKNIGIKDSSDKPHYQLFKAAVRSLTKCAIAISKKI